MFFTSTRDNNVKVTASKAIADGISPDGGLYIPEAIPQLSAEEIKALCNASNFSAVRSGMSSPVSVS